MLAIVANAAIRPVEVHALCSSHVADDEKLLIHVLCAQQCGRVLEAFDALTDILPPAAIRLAFDHATAAARRFAQAGLFLPDRAWRIRPLSIAPRLRAPRASAMPVHYVLH
jgi:hypothetical protein